MPLTLEMQLDTLQLAIQKLEANVTSSVTINGRSVNYQNLDILYEREKYLQKRITRGAGGITTTTLFSSDP